MMVPPAVDAVVGELPGSLVEVAVGCGVGIDWAVLVGCAFVQPASIVARSVAVARVRWWRMGVFLLSWWCHLLAEWCCSLSDCGQPAMGRLGEGDSSPEGTETLACANVWVESDNAAIANASLGSLAGGDAEPLRRFGTFDG